MPGVVFLIVVPTANFERELIYGANHEVLPMVSGNVVPGTLPMASTSVRPVGGGNNNNNNNNVNNNNNNLNINLPENNNAILRLEVELRDKNAPKYRRGVGAGGRGRGMGGMLGGGGRVPAKRAPVMGVATTPLNASDAIVPLEKVLEELLTKLEIEHVTWTTGKKGYFHHVVFPLQSGEPCETTLHCLTELGIGTKLNSSVSVLPCSVSYDAITDVANIKDEYSSDDLNGNEDLSKWNNFVESIKSKLTVKQVVDGVRAGGALSFDYLLLIVTADSLAALGLVENNAPNIVAAMLVSPLMGPVMSITFGTIISDRDLIRVGFISLALGMFISCLFGFVFGLILGTTEMPWGNGDWPTEEMRGRGNVRSLWMGVLWALTSGTGVAVALLQGSAGPLIGVAISASLLPPVVNCGLFWALACIWLIYPGIRMPHLKDEPSDGNSSYPFIYTDYLPTEFLINGIVSCLLTVVNVICIFITAIIVLKIKEVSAPYTASPDLKRFWETDLRTVRKSNRSTMRQRKGTLRDKLLPGGGYQGLEEPRNRELDTVLEQALKEAADDVTFKKVKRMSYASNAVGELPQRLAKMAGLNQRDKTDLNVSTGSRAGSRLNSIRNSKVHADLKALDKLVSTLLDQQQQQQQHPISSTTVGATDVNVNANVNAGGGNINRKTSLKLNRWRPTSRSAHSFHLHDAGAGAVATVHAAAEHGNFMPTIMETGVGGAGAGVPTSWSNSLERTPGAVRNVLHSLANAPQRLSQSIAPSTEENLNLTQNYEA